jgi:hypothetical protein
MECLPRKMPIAFISQPPKTVEQLQLGQEGYLTFTDILVDRKDLSAYIRKDAEVRHAGLNTVKVLREPDGFHIQLRFRECTYQPADIMNYADLIPAASVIENLSQRPASAHMISSRIKAAKKPLSNLQIGEAGYLSAGYVVVDEVAATYLMAASDVSDDPDIFSVKISRERDGFHLTIPNRKQLIFRVWKDITSTDLIPLVEVKEEGPTQA